MDKSVKVEFSYKGRDWDINGYYAMDEERFTKGVFGAWHRAYNKMKKEEK